MTNLFFIELVYAAGEHEHLVTLGVEKKTCIHALPRFNPELLPPDGGFCQSSHGWPISWLAPDLRVSYFVVAP